MRIHPTILYAVAFAGSFLATLAVTPVAAGVAKRLGILDHPAENKYHQTATPYLGGLAVAVGLVLVGGLTAGASGQMLTVMLCALGLGITGLLDDQFHLRPILKIAVETAAGLALWLVGIRAGLFGIEALDLVLTVIVVVGVINAVNFLDNMDGLCAGVSALCAATFFVIAAMGGQYLVASLALAVAGASLGFLRYNFPPSRIFLGDAGSLLLGFLLAALGLKLRLVGQEGFIRSAVPVLALGVPVLDTLLVVIDRVRGGRPFYVGGTDHSSHRLAVRGLSPRRVALTVYGAQVVFSGLALLLLYGTTPVAIGVISVAVVTAVVLLRFFLAIEYRVEREQGPPVVLEQEAEAVRVVQDEEKVD